MLQVNVKYNFFKKLLISLYSKEKYEKARVTIVVLAFLLLRLSVQAQVLPKEQWVDSVFNTLTPDMRIAQLLMIRGYSNKDSVYNAELVRLVSDFNIGGVCFFQGGPVRQSILTNRIQEQTDVPVFIAIDGEWGLGMRLDSTISFPKQMTLGATVSDEYIYSMGLEIAKQMKRMGIHMNFAPVSDINNNPNNPVINARSFGEDRQLVAEKAYAYMKGMQDGGLIAVAKHFPGHGDTDIDSHVSLPIIDKPFAAIDSIELFPFKYLINNGVDGIMVSHLRVPGLDPSTQSIATLSQPILEGLLRKKLGFNGMIITDGMDMRGLVDFSNIGRVEADALKAGNDILLLPVDARQAIFNICNAIDDGYITQQLIDEKCKKVLRWKYEAGLAMEKAIIIEELSNDLNNTEARLVSQLANAQAITLLRNKNDRIPLKGLDSLKIASLAIGDKAITPFQEMLSKYAPVDHFNLPKEATACQFDSISNLLEPYNLVIAAFVKSSDLPQKRFNITEKAAAFIDSLASVKNTVLSIFASPYSLAFFTNIDSYEALTVSYQDNSVMQELTAQALFGGRTMNGRLPVSAGVNFRAGDGIDCNELIRVGFGLPEEVMISSADLFPIIDSLVYDGIDKKAFPGAQILIIKHGKVILNKAFGHQDYESYKPVKTDDLYDLASLTKVLGTTLMSMKLIDDKVINLDKKLSSYNSKLKKSNKKDITIRDIMAHQARLQSFIPFYQGLNTDTVKGFSNFLARHYSVEYPNRIADALYGRDDLPERIIDSIIQSDILVSKGYRYSDLGFILLAETYEDLTEMPFSHYLKTNFYDKLGLSTMGFHPRDRFSIERIAPTEFDRTFRRQIVHGDVHDQTAALLGGVAGHAGLFSNALDVGITMQMIMQNGEYGGERYLDSTTVAEFTSTQFPQKGNRRGAGFDKPPLNPYDPSPACPSVSSESYGHSGFTGTYVWADPAVDLIYVFLSNRVHPDAGNNKITQMNIRTNIHEAIYNAIRKGYTNQISQKNL